MKPSGILLFTFAVILLLIAAAQLFPENGVLLSPGIRIRFVTIPELLSVKETQYVDISEILKNQEILARLQDDISRDDYTYKPDTVNIDSLLAGIVPMEYPAGDTTILYGFFSSLQTASSKGELIRIMHYGDSQIENDRISSLLRNRLQLQFGGSGVGLVPVYHPYAFGLSINQSVSDNWSRYSLAGISSTAATHNRYGALAGFSRFSSDDSLSPDTSQITAWVKFSQSPYSYQNTKTYTQLKVYYGYNTEPFLSELYVSDHLVDADFFPPNDELNIIKWNLENPASEVTLVFKGNESPEVYAIALDAESGVAVDNIPMRGSSGLFFNNINRELLAQMYEELNVKLIILQFGGNYVPSGIDNFSGFENRFSSQISTLRELCPKAAILVVGVADMSMKDKNRYISYPNVEKVRNALKNAALKNNAAFWDLYEAMGGENSMPSWVNATPPLATSDFVHFNTLGAKTVAGMLYNAIMYDYRKFLQQNINDPFISEIN